MPKTCCSCQEEKYPMSGDTCMCGCAYLNGWVAILGVQLFALVGMLFSIAAMGDCSFMELDERLFFPPDLDENLPLKVTQTKYVGFLTWQALDGTCYFYNSGSDAIGQINEYIDILGRDMEIARIFAMLTACLSFVQFCYLLSFTCSSQTRGVRYFNTVMLSVILTALQGVTFLAFNSSFCDEYGCTFSRSAGFSAAAMGCFFLSGLCFCCSSDYPGPRLSNKIPRLMGAPAQVAPDQSRDLKEEVAGNDPEYSEEYVMQEYDEEEVLDDQDEEMLEDQDEEEVLDDQGDEMIEEEIVEDDEEIVEEEYVDDSQFLTNTTDHRAEETVFTEVTADHTIPPEFGESNPENQAAV